MLDSETKRRIDTARDILVGKLPDPKSQVEQITIALIYKFMDDMDVQAVEYGGDPSFFVGDFERYGWRKLFSPTIGGHELLALYGEAITKLNQNPQLPQLFRDIFKNAFLPYRDPETLKLFLKTINEFKYDHSERLGDAFEYLLSVLGSQGDAGQFRTPRHIIDFIVEVVQPKKNETICDPACGTAGFLISSYKHILRENTRRTPGDLLTPDERRRLMTNFVGYDISPDMVRLSLVNMYLHGFPDPHIYEYDTLTSLDRWNESFDVIMANPPFMSPKGGIKPHSKFSLQANRSEVLFADYIAEHINPVSGRAGMIVPEGIIFQSATAYRSLRKMLIEKSFLYAVVSLPAGVFNPYSGVKTSILFFDKTLAAKSDKIFFVKIQNDGFSLGAQRRPIAENDLPDALNAILDFQKAILSGDTTRFADGELPLQAFAVEKSRIIKNADFNLSADRYKTAQTRHSKFEMVSVEDLIEDVKYTTKIQRTDFLEHGKYPIVDQSEKFIAGYWNNEDDVFRITKPIVIFGDHTRVFKYLDFDFVLGADGVKVLKPNEKIDPKFFYFCLQSLEIKNLGYSRHYKELKEKTIPLPPLSVQKEIVERVEGYQRLIDGAKQVLQNFKPNIQINPDWQMVELGEVCSQVQYGLSEKMNTDGKGFRCFRMNEIKNGHAFDNGEMKFADISQKEFEKYQLRDGDILFNRTNSFEHVGRTGIFHLEGEYCFASYLIRLEIDKSKANPYYVNLFMNTESFQQGIKLSASRAIGQANINAKSLQQYPIPLPPLEEQKQIVAQIEREQSLVNANKELIEIYEQKIKDEINQLWEQ